MSQPEKRENSVLFSLRELQQIEEERVNEEEDAKQRAEEERIRAEMEAKRKAEEAEQAKLRAAEEEKRRIQEEKERLEREERIRVGEAEARARAEHQARLEQQRMAQELDLRRQEVSKKRPTALIAIAAFLVVAVAGLGYWAYSSSKESDKIAAEKEQAERDKAKAEQDKERLAKEKAALEKELQELNDQLAAAEEAVKTAKNKKDLEAAQARVNKLRARIKTRRRTGPRKTTKKPGTIKLSPACIKNPLDPSCRRR